MRHDPELDELFTDPAERRVAELLRDSRPGPPPLDPSYQNALRMKLLAEARRTLSQPARPQWFASRPLQGMVALAASLAIVVLAGVYVTERRTQPAPIQVVSSLEKNNVATAEPIRIDFRGPVNQNAVAHTVEIQPAAQYTTRWEGQTLVITPLHPLAPNTGYQLRVEPSAGQPGPAPTPAAVVRIVTAPSPPPPVRPPSFQAENITFLPENRIADPGTVGSAVWTPDGQGLVVTRISSELGTTGSPGTTLQPSSATAPPDLWLMTPQGTFLRRLARAASEPAVAPNGSAIAFWRIESSGEVSLQVSALEDDGSRAVKITKLGSVPDRPPVWVGTDRLAYVDNGFLHIVDVRGTAIASPKLTVTGSMGSSPDGKTLAIETSHGPVLYDVATQATSPLPTGGGKFSWAPTGDLAFVVTQPAGTQLWILPRDKREPLLRLTGAAGDIWSDISWAPDTSSLLFASRPATPEGGSVSHAFLVNVQGKDGRVPFGRNQHDEYAAPRWSPQGTTVVFTRHDETGRAALWSTEVRPGQLSAADRAQLDAQNAVDKFMRARLEGNLSDAQSLLSPDALAKYQSADRPFAGKQDPYLARYYPASVQLLAPDKFLIVVRIVQADAKSKQETGFFEERLTVARHDQGFRIDGVELGKTIRLGQGPAVVSVDLRPTGASGADANRRQLRVQFDADLDPATVSRDSIYVQDADGNRVKSTISFDQARHLATLTFPRLEPGKYQLVVSTAVADFKGRTLEEDYEYPLVVTEP